MTQPQTLGVSQYPVSLNPSTLIRDAILGASQTVRLVGTDRAADFPVYWQAQLASIGMDRYERALANDYLDRRWEQSGPPPATAPEVIVGSGFHAAVYAAVRVQSGFPRPVVVERGTTVGGTFAMTPDAGFYLNSSNRPGPSGLTQRLGVNLNNLPGAPVQVSQLSTEEYQTNADMAYVIRTTLAQYADVFTAREVKAFDSIPGSDGVELTFRNGETMRAGRVIDARGLGDPVTTGSTGPNILTFPQFMERMSRMWPLRNVRRVVVAGDGDSAKCAVEALMGIGPMPMRSPGGLDRVERVDWYAQGLPTSFDAWGSEVAGRYIRIGRQLRTGEYGSRLAVTQRRMPFPVQLPDGVLVEGRKYDLAILCIGNREDALRGSQRSDFRTFVVGTDDEPCALRHYDYSMFRVGPHARLPFTTREFQDGLNAISNNQVSMFRTGPKTATLAAGLGAVVVPEDSEPDGPEDEYDRDDDYYGID